MTARTALRATALATAALALTACNSTKTKPTPPPAAAPAASSTATAGGTTTGGGTAAGGADGQALAAKLALTAKEWGNTFKPDDPYEDTQLNKMVLDASCKQQDGGKDSTLTGRMGRTVLLPQAGKTTASVYAWSDAEVFTSASAAQSSIATADVGGKKCSAYTSGDDQYAGVHEVKAPAVAGAEEVHAEEGMVTYAIDGGQKSGPYPYMFVIARKGPVVISVNVDMENGESVGSSEIYVQSALKKLTAKW